MKSIITLPGLIDMHVHLRTPGQAEKEDFTTGTMSALAGGFTTVIDMPNNSIPIMTQELLQEKMQLASQGVVCDIGFYFGSLGENLSEFREVTRNVFGLKLYLNETTGNFLIDKRMLAEIFADWPEENGPILVHAEDDAIDAVIENVQKTRKKTHFCHISLKSDLEKIIHAKHKKLPVTCGVTPHHLFLTKKYGEELGPYARMKPFLKSDEDVQFLWNNISEIDVVESDHAPHTRAEKEGDQPPFGVPGLETTLPLLLNAVYEEKMTLSDIRRLCHDGPKKILDLPDQDSEVIVDMNVEYEIRNEDLFTKCSWTPFHRWRVRGKILEVKLNGEMVFEKGQIMTEKGSGKILHR